MVLASKCYVPLALILAHVVGILLDILERESNLPLLRTPETRRKGGNRGVRESERRFVSV